MEFLRELYDEEAPAVSSRVRCVTRIMAMPGIRTLVAEDYDLSTRACGRPPMNDKLGCGCKENAQARIGVLVQVQTMQARRWNNREHGYVKLPGRWRDS